MPRIHDTTRLTTDEWLERVGEHIRADRILRDLDQQQLADLASVSRQVLSNLENGNGSTLSTLVKVVRALGREDWFEQLAETDDVSPIALMREERRKPKTPRRVSRPRTKDLD